LGRSSSTGNIGYRQAAVLLLALGYDTDMRIYGKNLPSPPNEIDV
jgi:hypothetical protein